MGTSLIGVRWTDRESKRYMDVLRSEWFATPGAVAEITHDVLGPKGGLYRARCQLLVRDTVADLDYEPFADFNLRQGMYLGLLRLHFEPGKREMPIRVEWRYSGRKTFSSRVTAELVRYPLPPLPPYKPKLGAVKTSTSQVLERPGQVRFRSTLMIAYRGRCCISGCPVSEALEGAHIDRFCGASSDHPQNGLLLRQDLHSLFDAGLLAVDPDTLIVHFAARTLTWAEYAALNGKARLAEPKDGGNSYSPSRDALRRRWRRFKRNEQTHDTAQPQHGADRGRPFSSVTTRRSVAAGPRRSC